MKRLSRILAAICCASLVAASPAARAAYPDKPIRMVIPFAPGATTGVIAQVMSTKLGAELGQPVVMDYRPGAAGNIGAEIVAKAPADGYTVLLGTISILTFNPALYKKLPFDPVKDFQPLSVLVTTQNVVVVDPALPIHDVKELVSYAKAHPGELTYGSSGTGASLHLTGEFFARQTGTQLRHVPYKGGGPARADLLGGHISMMFSDLTAVPLVKAGKLRAIAVTGTKRYEGLPDVPTLTEAGLPIVVELWYGMLAPAGTPQPVVERLNAAIAKVLAMPDVKATLAEQGAMVATDTSVAGMQQAIRSDTEKWAPVIRAAKIEMD